MVGDSLRSDILPALELGAVRRVHPLFQPSGSNEAARARSRYAAFLPIGALDQLPGLLEQLEVRG